MSAGEGPRGADRAIARLRWLLVSAQDDASARREVLPALSRCTVLVPTMPGAPDKLRFVPCAGGGSSLALFTGHDALEHAAKKHGWAQGTQSVSFRAMSARDALELAETQRLRSVIVDAAAEHALELKDDDVSLYLSRGTGEFSPESLKPSRGTGEFGPPEASRGTGDHGQPRKHDESKHAVREEIAPRKARDARRDDEGVSSAPMERPSRTSSAGLPPKTRPSTQPTPRRRDSSGSMRRKAKLAEIDDPFSSSPPRKAQVKAADTGGQGRRVPSLNAPPLSKEMPSSPFESSAPPSTPASEKPPAKARALRDYSHIRDETVPLEDTSTAEAARQSAARIATLSDPAVPMEMFGRVDSLPVPPAQAAAPAREPVKPATPPAASLPMVGFSAAPPPEPVAPVASPVAEPAPKSLVKTLPPPAVMTAPPPEIISDPPPQPIAPARIKAVEPVEERRTGTVAKPPAESTSDATTHASALSETVLAAIAEELRKFPEAEWACQLDDGDKPVIGIRVDPSYLQRTRDIEASVVGAAKKAGAAIVPLIVSTPAATKDARARGKMFFPWKKKK